jgi:hypothetical protein
MVPRSRRGTSVHAKLKSKLAATLPRINFISPFRSSYCAVRPTSHANRATLRSKLPSPSSHTSLTLFRPLNSPKRVILNTVHVNLATLPVLNIAKSKHLQWLNIHLYSQFSDQEHNVREAGVLSRVMLEDLHVNLK